MHKKVIHLYDDEKIVDRTQDLYLRLFPEVEHVGLIFPVTEKPRYVKDFSRYHVVKPHDAAKMAKSLDYSEVACIYIHFLSTPKVKFMKHVPRSVSIGWGVYGGDLYNRYLKYFGFELVAGYKDSLKNRLLNPLKKAVRKLEFEWVLSRLAFVCACKPDYDLIAEYANKQDVPALVDTFCYDMETLLGKLYRHPFEHGKRIVVGNSGSSTNNHLYVLECLKGHDIGGYTLSLQMAYLALPDYKTRVCSAYENVFGGSVEVCDSFVSLEEYNSRLLDGAIFVYGNWRQEAMGNILVALYLGAKVYLSEKNPMLAYFQKQGAVLFALEQIGDDFLQPLSPAEREANRHYIDTHHNRQLKENIVKEKLTKYFCQ